MEIKKKLILLFVLVTLLFSIFNFMKTSLKESKPLEVTGEIKKLEENQIQVSFLPITEGEATLIQVANQDFYLIDTGFKKYADELLFLLRKHGITHLKGIILTNSSLGQTGGLTNVLEEFIVDNLYIPNLISNTFKIKGINQELSTYKLSANNEMILGPNLKLKILGPTEPLSLSPQANSLVFQLVHKDIRFLFTGEINGEIEEKLVNSYNLDSEILKVSDYGNNSASIPEFLKEVDPQVGIIFSSDSEYYGLSDDVLERLNESWIDVYIMKRFGEVQIVSDGNNYDVEIIKTVEE